MLMKKINLLKTLAFAIVFLSLTNTNLSADHPDNSQENAAFADASNPNHYPSQGSMYLPLGGATPNTAQLSCQGGACKAQAQYQAQARYYGQPQGQCQGGSCNVGNAQQNANYQGGCQNGQCYHDHYGTHYGEQNGWHYPHANNRGCNGGSCNAYNGQCGNNTAYGQNCQSGCCDAAHRPDQYNVNYNGYPYDCSYNNFTYPYDGSGYYSVHPWLDGF